MNLKALIFGCLLSMLPTTVSALPLSVIMSSGTQTMNGRLTILNNLGIGAAPSYALDVTGSGRIIGQQIVGGTLTVQGSAFSVGGSTLVAVGGNVGIGTTNPLTLLEVYGGGNSLINVTSNGLMGIGTVSPGYMLDVQSAGSNLIHVGSSAATGLFMVPDNNMTLTNGDININGPGADLFIYANIPLGAPKIYFKTQKSAGAAVNQAVIYSSVTIPSTGVSNLTFQTASGPTPTLADRMVINATGLGVGTTAPTQKLDIVGSGTFSGNVGIGTTNPVGTLDVTGTGLFSGNVGIGTTNPRTLLEVSVGTFNVTAAGNVGIGTTNPGTTLDVNGGVTVRGQQTVTSTLTVQGNTFSVGASTLVVTGGNVGIGTAAPAVKFDLVGDERIASGGLRSGDVGVGSYSFWSLAANEVNAFGSNLILQYSGGGNVGVGTTNPTSKLMVGTIALAGSTISTVTSCGNVVTFGGATASANIVVGSGVGTTCSISWTPAFATASNCTWFDKTTAHVVSTIADGVSSSTATFVALTDGDTLSVKCNGY